MKSGGSSRGIVRRETGAADLKVSYMLVAEP